MESYDYHGQNEFGNAESFVSDNSTFNNPNQYDVRSYTFGEPLELVVSRLIERVEALEAELASSAPIHLDLYCPDCPGVGNGCCLDDGIDLN